jgi:ABC-type amino acid transport substrate-binding protein
MAYGRTGDVRFQGQPLEALIKDTTFKIATLDGDFSNIIQKSKFPTASVLTEPQHVPVSQLAEDVATGKADITFLDRADAHHYIKENPGKIVELPYPPMHLGDDVLAFRKADDELRELFNVAIRKIVHQGTVAEVLEKYDLPAGSYYLPAKPYEEIK